MPEIAEVHRAATVVSNIGKGRKIGSCETFPDDIVFCGGTDHLAFKENVTGREVIDVKRHGKYFWLVLSGGINALLHLGMTGIVQVKGEEALYYRKKSKDGEEWPPKWSKFIMTFGEGEEEKSIAFRDPRRLARIRIVRGDVSGCDPVRSLGFDPINNMPSFDQYLPSVTNRACPIKALLLDQKFNAGVGNWVADEILYHSAIHPERRANSLSEEEVQRLYDSTLYVCRLAVECLADHFKFPSHWLFMKRWGKGKKGDQKWKGEVKDQVGLTQIVMKDGSVGDIRWVTVGGRTSAYVVQVQKLEGEEKGEGEDDGDEEEEEEEEKNDKRKRPDKTKKTTKKPRKSKE
ncbi:hypothetical protein PROFUN_12413 [Planoprotostelium fungivorum]|uniref:Formamidopyrimidine-DNA glycosylase catalytic domain-containing protein n=1 Tax=Planoprotostelium fungivorum TaxID=1890364 RepID=A0A2P6N7J2_9EUKA|nr:hypothetical protein PROFUN_12413 [Planoprotostelium fungivorum]